MDKKDILKAEDWVKRSGSMIGHRNADLLQEVITFAKSQQKEIESLREESYLPNEQFDLHKEVAELKTKVDELEAFKSATEEIVGDVIIELILKNSAEKE